MTTTELKTLASCVSVISETPYFNFVSIKSHILIEYSGDIKCNNAKMAEYLFARLKHI